MLPVVQARVISYNRQFEGVTHHMYLDVKGFVTVGVGTLLDSAAAASGLGFTHGLGGAAAGAGEKSAAWTAVHNATPGLPVDVASPGHDGGGDAYGALTDLRLGDAGINALAMGRANAYDASNAADFPNYPNFPADGQLGLIGMRWPGSFGTFVEFKKHVLAGRWFGAARECFFNEANNPGLKPRNLNNRWLFCLAGRVMAMGLPTTTLYYDNPGANKLYLFKGGQYVRYDWNADTVDAGYPAAISGWKLPGVFASGVNAAVDGLGAYKVPSYLGRTYFFRGSQYVRYDWDSDTVDVGPAPLSAWGLSGSFAQGVDAAVNGQGQYFGKLYFFKGDKYVRYDWTTDKVDQAEQTISAGWQLPGAFASGIDAAVSGEGPFSGKLYFFKGSQYVRCNWKPYAVETNPPVPISPAWSGLAPLGFDNAISATVNAPGSLPSVQA